MPAGKLASQAGHAYLNTYLECLEQDPETATEYQKDGIGSKICLKAKNLTKLQTLTQLLRPLVFRVL